MSVLDTDQCYKKVISNTIKNPVGIFVVKDGVRFRYITPQASFSEDSVFGAILPKKNKELYKITFKGQNINAKIIPRPEISVNLHSLINRFSIGFNNAGLDLNHQIDDQSHSLSFRYDNSIYSFSIVDILSKNLRIGFSYSSGVYSYFTSIYYKHFNFYFQGKISQFFLIPKSFVSVKFSDDTTLINMRYGIFNVNNSALEYKLLYEKSFRNGIIGASYSKDKGVKIGFRSMKKDEGCYLVSAQLSKLSIEYSYQMNKILNTSIRVDIPYREKPKFGASFSFNFNK